MSHLSYSATYLSSVFAVMIILIVFLLLSMYILIFVYVFLDEATLTEVFACFFLSCKANARV